MKSKLRDSRPINVGEYCLLYVDILNQKEELQRIKRLPRSKQEESEFLESLQQIIGKISTYRDFFDDFLQNAMAYKPPRDERVPDTLYNEVVAVMQHDVRTQYQRIESEMQSTGLRRAMAASCIGLVAVDDDGNRILDYLGSQARTIFPDARNLVRPALEFVK